MGLCRFGKIQSHGTLSSHQIDDEGARIFETDIARNVTLNTLDTMRYGTGPMIWQQSSILVAILRCRATTLVLYECKLTDAIVKSLSTA